MDKVGFYSAIVTIFGVVVSLAAFAFFAGETFGAMRRRFNDLQVDTRGAWLLANGVRRTIVARRGAIPYYVHPLGLLVDTLLFAAMAWMLLFAPGVVRRTHRRRAGKCLRCGYLLKGRSPCPECGAPSP